MEEFADLCFPAAAPPPLSGDFVNDIIIVCTLAILIGQNYRTDLKEAVEIKQREVRDFISKIPKGEEIIKEEQIRTLSDQIKNFNVTDPFRFWAFFYACILISVLLDLISLNQNKKQFEYLLSVPVNGWRFYFELIVWLSLGFYGVTLFLMRRSYNRFCQHHKNLCTSLSILLDTLTIKPPPEPRKPPVTKRKPKAKKKTRR